MVVFHSYVSLPEGNITINSLLAINKVAINHH